MTILGLVVQLYNQVLEVPMSSYDLKIHTYSRRSEAQRTGNILNLQGLDNVASEALVQAVCSILEVEEMDQGLEVHTIKILGLLKFKRSAFAHINLSAKHGFMGKE